MFVWFSGGGEGGFRSKLDEGDFWSGLDLLGSGRPFYWVVLTLRANQKRRYFWRENLK